MSAFHCSVPVVATKIVYMRQLILHVLQLYDIIPAEREEKKKRNKKIMNKLVEIQTHLIDFSFAF